MGHSIVVLFIISWCWILNNGTVSSMKSKSIALYQNWHDKLLNSIREICTKCVDPRKEKERLDLANPLNCSCRCECVDGPLSNVMNINADIKK